MFMEGWRKLNTSVSTGKSGSDWNFIPPMYKSGMLLLHWPDRFQKFDTFKIISMNLKSNPLHHNPKSRLYIIQSTDSQKYVVVVIIIIIIILVP